MSNWTGKYGPLLIAEIGGNHEGDMDYARRLTDLAIESGADFIKFQLYTGDTLVSPVESPQRNQHFKKFQLTPENYIELAEKCEAANVGFMASVWNPDFFEWIDKYMPIYKIGSGDMTAYPVLKKTAELGKPMIVSTGISTTDEVLDMVSFIQSIDEKYKDPEYLAILQCTSMYPIPYEDANLNVMHTIRRKTGLTVGYSDHTEGRKALEIAVAMGAQILEFHFTDSREGKKFRDHKVSLTRDEVHDLQKSIQDIISLQGSFDKKPLTVEGDHVTTFRRAVYPNREIKKGEIIKEEDLVTLRPNHGIDARQFYYLLGKKATKDLKAFGALNLEDFA